MCLGFRFGSVGLVWFGLVWFGLYSILFLSLYVWPHSAVRYSAVHSSRPLKPFGQPGGQERTRAPMVAYGWFPTLIDCSGLPRVSRNNASHRTRTRTLPNNPNPNPNPNAFFLPAGLVFLGRFGFPLPRIRPQSLRGFGGTQTELVEWLSFTGVLRVLSHACRCLA